MTQFRLAGALSVRRVEVVVELERSNFVYLQTGLRVLEIRAVLVSDSTRSPRPRF